jgi:hypothetical protein
MYKIIRRKRERGRELGKSQEVAVRSSIIPHCIVRTLHGRTNVI